MEFEKLTKAKMTEEYKKLLAEKEKAVKDSETFCKELKECKVSEAGLKKALEASEKTVSKFSVELKQRYDEVVTLKNKIAEMEKAEVEQQKEITLSKEEAKNFEKLWNEQNEAAITIKNGKKPPENLAIETSFEDETFDEETFAAPPDYKKKKHKKLKKQKPGSFEGLTENEIVQRLTGRKLG